MFNFCDDLFTLVAVSKVCKRINALVTTVHFPKQTKLKFCGAIDDTMFLEDFDEIMSCFGKYLVDLEIYYVHFYDGQLAGDTYKMIGRSVGDRLRRLVIDDSTIFED